MAVAVIFNYYLLLIVCLHITHQVTCPLTSDIVIEHLTCADTTHHLLQCFILVSPRIMGQHSDWDMICIRTSPYTHATLQYQYNWWPAGLIITMSPHVTTGPASIWKMMFVSCCLILFNTYLGSHHHIHVNHLVWWWHVANVYHNNSASSVVM